MELKQTTSLEPLSMRGALKTRKALLGRSAYLTLSVILPAFTMGEIKAKDNPLCPRLMASLTFAFILVSVRRVVLAPSAIYLHRIAPVCQLQIYRVIPCRQLTTIMNPSMLTK